MPGATFVGATLLLGWAMLWPLRGRLGEAGFHLAAYPAGLLGWSLLAALHSVPAVPYSPVSVAVSALVVVAGFAALVARVASGDPAGATVRPASFALAGTVALAVAVASEAWGLSFATPDSWANYGAMGYRIRDTGLVFSRLMEERSWLVPAMHAAHIFFGGEWLTAAYPTAAVWVAGITGWGVLRSAPAGVSRAARSTVAAATVALMVSAPMFAWQAFYVHSHMVTALFLTLAILALVMSRAGASASWLAVAGVGAAGVALARPDGLAYAAVPLALAMAVALEDDVRRRAAAFLASFWAPLALAYGVAYARLGVWETAKLNGRLAAASLAALALLAAVLLVAPRVLPAFRAWLSGEPLMRLGVAASAVAVASLAALRPEHFVKAATPMMTNLVALGSHGPLWTALAATLALAALFPSLRRRAPGLAVVASAILVSLAVAMVVHAAEHPGRLGATDSFNRIAFHFAPLAWWFVGALAMSAVAGLRPKEGA